MMRLVFAIAVITFTWLWLGCADADAKEYSFCVTQTHNKPIDLAEAQNEVVRTYVTVHSGLIDPGRSLAKQIAVSQISTAYGQPSITEYDPITCVANRALSINGTTTWQGYEGVFQSGDFSHNATDFLYSYASITFDAFALGAGAIKNLPTPSALIDRNKSPVCRTVLVPEYAVINFVRKAFKKKVTKCD